MKKNIYLLWVLFSFILFSSCEYELSEDFYNDIKVEEPLVSLSLIDFKEGELLRVSKQIEYNYRSSSKNALYEIRFHIDGNEIKTSYEPNGSFFIDIKNLEDGDHKLEIEYFFRTGSGSLAEISGGESYQVKEELNFKVDKTLTPISILDIKHKDGSIYVEWNKPDNIEKNKEVLLYINDGHTRRTIDLLKNNLINKGKVRDSLTIKFKVKYQIYTKNEFNEKLSEIKDFIIRDSVVSVKHEVIDVNSYKIKWNEHPLYANFKDYELEGRGITTRRIDNRGGEMLVNHSFKFGQSIYYSIIPKRDVRIYDNQRYSRTVFYGSKYNGYEYLKVIYDKDTDSFFALSVPKKTYPYKVIIYKLDPINLSIIEEVVLNTTTASFVRNGESSNFIINNDDLIIDLEDKSLIVDKYNLTIKKEFLTKDYYDGNYNYLTAYRNGLLIVDRGSHPNHQIDFYDTDSKKLVKSFKPGFFSVYSFNNANSYFSFDDRIYKIKEKKIVEVITGFEITDRPVLTNLYYLKDRNSLIFNYKFNNSIKDNDVILYNLDSGSYEVLASLEGLDGYFNYDESSNKVFLVDMDGYKDVTTVWTHDINTNQVSNKKEVFYWEKRNLYFYYNDLLISKHGVYSNDYLLQ